MSKVWIGILGFSLLATCSCGEDIIWRLHKVNEVKYPNAKCLDGSPGAFWFLPGSGSGINSFLIHHQGGGWCINNNDCYARSQGFLGSSRNWEEIANCSNDSDAQPCVYDGDSGLRSTVQAENSLTYNWNKIYIGYCDGASYSGTVSAPIPVAKNNRQVMHYKGRFILDAVYDTLLESFDMNKSSEIIISGTSAGGLAVYLHADYLSAKIKTAAMTGNTGIVPRVVAVPDAGFFMDIPSITGEYLYTPNYKAVFEFQNVSNSVNAGCIKHYSNMYLDPATGQSESWKCFMAPYTLPFITTPLFIVNSMADSWQGANIMGLICDPTVGSKSRPNPKGKRFKSTGNACSSAEIEYLNNYRDAFLLSSMNEFLQKPDSGAWLGECWAHPLTDYQHYFSSVFVQSRTMRDTLFDWYLGLKSNWTVVDGTWGTNIC